MKKKVLENKLHWATLTGVLFSTSYPPFPAWALFFCFVPLWCSWYSAPKLKTVILSGIVAQFIFTFIGFNWIAHTAMEYGHIPMIPSFFILFGFCSFASLNVVFAGALSWTIRKRWNLTPGWFFLLTAVLSAAFEWFYPMIFPWNMGYSLLFSKFNTSQLAEFVGFNLLSLTVGLANAAFATAVMRYPRRGWSRPLVAFTIIFFLSENLGHLTQERLGTEDGSISILMVQPNVGNFEKFFAERGNGYQEPVVKKDFLVTDQGLQGLPTPPQLVVWPETAYPASLDPESRGDIYFTKLVEYVRSRSINLITGAYSDDPPGVSNRRNYNAVFAVNKEGMPSPPYRKNLLLAFGEYFPGAQYLPFLKKLVPEIADFGRGNGPSVFNIEGAGFSPLICYEGLDTLFVGSAVSAGAQILVNLTNDSWFGKNFEPYQHMIMTVARTVEYRRPMIRSTNTGISVVADARGRILLTSPQDQEWAQVIQVPYFKVPRKTVFSRLAPFLSEIFLGLILITVFAGIYCRGKQRRT